MILRRGAAAARCARAPTVKIGTPREFGELLADEYALWAAVREGRQRQGGVENLTDGILSG